MTIDRSLSHLMLINSDPIHNTSFSFWLLNEPNKLVLKYTGQERLASDKHSSILGPFMSYEENEVL